MRYSAPKLIATYAATTTIKSEKNVPPFEINQVSLTSGAAYQSAE